jgi:hypothetical protein
VIESDFDWPRLIIHQGAAQFTLVWLACGGLALHLSIDLTVRYNTSSFRERQKPMPLLVSMPGQHNDNNLPIPS